MSDNYQSKLNRCSKCEEQYKQAQQKVQAEPTKYEIKDKKDCLCQHRFNPTHCSNVSCFINNREMVCINEKGEEVNEKGQQHHEVCKGGASKGGSRQTEWTEFYKVKSGQVCDTCQKFINEKLKDWEVKAKAKTKELCQQGVHNSGGWLFNDGSGQMERSYTTTDCDCGKETWKNTFGDIEPHSGCKGVPQTPQINIVQLLDQLERYFIENNIKLIKRVNNKLVIEFNDGSSNNNPLTTEQQEQLTHYLKSKNKQSLNLSEVRELKNHQQQPNKKGGCGTVCQVISVIGIVLGLGLIGLAIHEWLKAKKSK